MRYVEYMFNCSCSRREQIAPPCSTLAIQVFHGVPPFDLRQHGAVPIVEMLQVSDTKLQDSVLKVSRRDPVRAWGDADNPLKYVLLPSAEDSQTLLGRQVWLFPRQLIVDSGVRKCL